MEEQWVPWDMNAYLNRVRSACFVCELLQGVEGSEHEIIHRDDVGVAFLARYPVVRGHVLVAPIDHKEHAIADFTAEEYLRLQGLVHRAGEALVSVVAAERLYVLSLGSQQGNRHVHWHLVPLPPGVPYDQQQTALFDERRGWLRLDPAGLAELAASITDAMRP